MGRKLNDLLRLIPGVIRSKGVAVKTCVEPSDWKATLSIPDVKDTHGFAVGRWALVSKGNYKGDLGYVSRIEPWGGVTLLLVPRLPTPHSSPTRKRPRKPSVPRLALFRPEIIQKCYGIAPSKQAHETYCFKGSTFEHGLILKEFDFHHVSLAFVLMPPILAALFEESGHPSILPSAFPRPPLETIFFQDEKVVICPSGQRGVVEVVHADHVEVRLSDGAGTMNIPEQKLRKDLTIGDFIQVLLGEQKGKTGWVDRIEGDTAHVIQKNQGITKILLREEVCVISEDFQTYVLLRNLGRDLAIGELVSAESGPFIGQMGRVAEITNETVHFIQGALDIMESFPVTVNWVCVTTPPWQYSQPSSTQDPELLAKYRKRDRVPWVGTGVLITKKGHPLRGRTAVVTDVLCGQETSSGLKIVIQLTSFNPNAPYKKMTLDYDDVVEQRSYKKLFDYFWHPNERFQPRQARVRSARFHPLAQPVESGSITPLPDPREVSSSTPAWDPSSRTPGSTPAWLLSPKAPEPRSSQSPAAPPASTSTPVETLSPREPPVEHVLFDSRLLNIKIKVKLTGGEHKNKEAGIVPSISDGRPVLQFLFYKTRINYPPKWVSVVHPNPTRDDGLLVVIKGEHCGKLVRRVHFRYGSDNIPIADLAVVHHSEGVKDSLTGEQLELTADNLGSVVEAQLDKALNKDLMKSLRTECRKIRAK